MQSIHELCWATKIHRTRRGMKTQDIPQEVLISNQLDVKYYHKSVFGCRHIRSNSYISEWQCLLNTLKKNLFMNSGIRNAALRNGWCLPSNRWMRSWGNMRKDRKCQMNWKTRNRCSIAHPCWKHRHLIRMKSSKRWLGKPCATCRCIRVCLITEWGLGIRMMKPNMRIPLKHSVGKMLKSEPYSSVWALIVGNSGARYLSSLSTWPITRSANSRQNNTKHSRFTTQLSSAKIIFDLKNK